MTTKTNIPKPKLTSSGFVKCPKELLAYLKFGCEIKQVGENKRAWSEKIPEYYLISPKAGWEVRLQSEHVIALETLDLIEPDYCGGIYYISKANFKLPKILDDT